MYEPLAIKYRPKTLNTVIGQEPIVNIIKSAIKKNRISNGIIITGIRGTGKTSIARIIAKAVNCLSTDEEDKPCLKCSSCISDNQNNIDIIEMDAASNTGVDDIRIIIESCQYKPALLKYKVFIIDEVHMLSKSAFNALLKTLEEPPSHIKFIFATTEIDKVPDTIISRCLRLDLKRVSDIELTQYLSEIANKESIAIDQETLRLIAKIASGSVRDALSILDQVFHIPEPIKFSDVSLLLGVIDNHTLANLLEKALYGDVKEVINLLREMYSKGANVRSTFDSILELLHYMMCIKTNTVNISDFYFQEEVKAKLKVISSSVTLPSLNQIWQVIIKGLKELQITPNDLITLEMTFIRICYLSEIPDLNTIINNIDQKKNNTISSIEDIWKLCGNDVVLLNFVKQYVGIKNINGKKITFNIDKEFPEKLLNKLKNILFEYELIFETTNHQDSNDQDLIKKALDLFPNAIVEE